MQQTTGRGWWLAGLAPLLLATAVQAVGHLTLAEEEVRVGLTTARVHLVSGVAVTRLEQRFAAVPGGEAQYYLTIPAGAEVTDLVSWAGRRRLQGRVVSSRFAQGGGVLTVLSPLAVSEDGATETVGFRLLLLPDEELLVQVEYLETLPATQGRRRYRLPLDAVCDSLTVVAQVHGDPGTRVRFDGPLAGTVTPGDQDGRVDVSAGVVGFDEPGVLQLDVETPDPASPQVLAWRPATGDGYYAVWLPAPEELMTTVAPALTVVVDLGRGSPGLLQAARQGLADLVAALPEQSLLALAVSRADSLAVELEEATPARRAAAVEALQTVGIEPPPGLSGGLGVALRAALGSRPVTEERPHYLLLITDESAAAADPPAQALLQSLAVRPDPLRRARVLQLGGRRFGALAGELARLLGAPLWAPPDSQAVLAELAGLAATLARPHAFVGRVDLPGARAWDLVPSRLGWVPVGDEVLQMGRYSTSAVSAVRVHGFSTSVDLGQPLVVAAPDSTAPPGQDEHVLIHEDFEAGTLGPFTVAGGTTGEWRADSPAGVLCVHGVREVARVYKALPTPSFTIEVRLRLRGSEGQILLTAADRLPAWRVDLMARQGLRVITAGAMTAKSYPVEQGRWYDLRVTVGNDTVRTWIDGVRVHDGVPMGGQESDGVIGLGAYNADSVFFDDVVVRLGTEAGGDARGLLPDRLATAPAMLWATERARQLEQQRLLFGRVAELEAALLDVGLTYRAVTETSPLALVVTAAAARQAATTPPAPTEVDSSRAEQIDAGGDSTLAATLLTANAPNPCNGITWISYRLPLGLTLDRTAQLVLYDVTGQRVRALVLPVVPGAAGQISWDGRDQSGSEVATGVYLYALEVGGKRLVVRRLAMVR